jgi:TonB family protein
MSEAATPGPGPQRHAAPRPPVLLVELEPAHRVFLRNLKDLWWSRPPAWPKVAARPTDLWANVFVVRPAPRRRILESGLGHLLVLAAVLYLPGLLPPRRPAQNPLLKDRTVTYYDVSDYLPAISSGSEPAKVARKGAPEYSRQPIVSLPKSPDNSLQTIVNPAAPHIITEHVELPNMVIMTPTPAPPVAAVTRPGQLTLPVMPVSIIAPSPKVRRQDLPQVDLPASAVIEPPPSLDKVQSKLGDLNIARSDVSVAEPKLPVAEQQAAGGAGEGDAPPTAALEGMGSGEKAVGQLIALGLRPEAPIGPIRLPSGSRRGIFAATPEGTPGAPGIPDIVGGGSGAGGSGSGDGGPGSGDSVAGLAGIFIGGTAVPGPVAVVAGPTAGPAVERPAASTRHPSPSDAQRIFASALPPRFSENARPLVPGGGTGGPAGSATNDTVANRVFGEKKYYQLTLNMPNLTSASGSWIVRFAELDPTPSPGELTSPVALTKVDPKYPPELRRQRIEGTVTLYAVIGADGKVRDAKVLSGIDTELDENARVALMRWQFRPAMKNGAAVDLEAVVWIPFRAGEIRY